MSLTIPLQQGWQGGSASIELETDEIQLDGGEIGPAVLIKVKTPTDPSGEMLLELGCGSLNFPPGAGRLEFWVAASFDQARQLRDALTEVLA